MLLGKKTLLTLHEVQNSAENVYFEYDAFAEVSEGSRYEYKVGYYMPMADWLCMGSPEQLTITAEPGNAGMSFGLKDEGTWGGEDEDLNLVHDIDRNVSMDVAVRHDVQAEVARA
jgi:hypothetical protein